MISAAELYEISISQSEEEFWDGLEEGFKQTAESRLQHCTFNIAANIMIQYNVEAVLKQHGYDVDILAYDEIDDVYTLQVFWDKTAITGEGVRRVLDIVQYEEAEGFSLTEE